MPYPLFQLNSSYARWYFSVGVGHGIKPIVHCTRFNFDGIVCLLVSCHYKLVIFSEFRKLFPKGNDVAVPRW